MPNTPEQGSTKTTLRGGTATAEPETATPTTTTQESTTALKPPITSFPEPGKEEGIYSRIGFYGAVQLRERSYFRPGDGRVYAMVVGVCSVLSDKELTGFETRGREDSSWAVVVEGQRERHVILGCQIGIVTSYQLTKGSSVTAPQNLERDAYIVP